MKNLKQRLAAAGAAVALLVGAAFGAVAIGGAAQATGPVHASNYSYSTSGGTGVYARLTRTQTALTVPSGSYANISQSTYWNMSQDGGFALFNIAGKVGLEVPVDGVYELSWNTILTSGGQGICGFALDSATPNGGILLGIGPVVNLAAATGNGDTTIVLPAGTLVSLWCYGSGGTMGFQNINSPAVSWSATLIQ
jgi:hypothetical protein